VNDPIRVLLIDDQPLVRRGMRAVLADAADMQVVSEARKPREAMRYMRGHAVDVAIVEIALADDTGLELVSDITSTYPDVNVLVCSVHDQPVLVERALQGGALGYILKLDDEELLVDAVRRVATGRVCVSMKVCWDLIEHSVVQGGDNHGDRAGEEPQGSVLARLSDRELEVFLMVGRGLTVQEIAERLHRSKKTIHSHRQNMKEKLNLSSNTELVHFATQWAMRKRGGTART